MTRAKTEKQIRIRINEYFDSVYLYRGSRLEEHRMEVHGKKTLTASDDDIKAWFSTEGGQSIPIREGQTKGEALKDQVRKWESGTAAPKAGVEVKQKGSKYAERYLREFDAGNTARLVVSDEGGTAGSYVAATRTVVIDESRIREAVASGLTGPEAEKKVEGAVKFCVAHEMAHADFQTWPTEQKLEWARETLDAEAVSEYSDGFRRNVKDQFRTYSPRVSLKGAYGNIAWAKERIAAIESAIARGLDGKERPAAEYELDDVRRYKRRAEDVLAGEPGEDGKYDNPMTDKQLERMTLFGNEQYAEMMGYLRSGAEFRYKINTDAIERLEKTYQKIRGRALTASERLAEAVSRLNALLSSIYGARSTAAYQRRELHEPRTVADGDSMLVETFLIDDRRNRNRWRASWESIKKYAGTMVGTPALLYEKCGRRGCLWDHAYGTISPSYNATRHMQERHAVGRVVSVRLDEDTHTAYAVQRVTDPRIRGMIRDGRLRYVSVGIFPDRERTVGRAAGDDEIDIDTTGWRGLHLQWVSIPAYGPRSRVTAVCEGAEAECARRIGRRDPMVLVASARLAGLAGRAAALLGGFTPGPDAKPDADGYYWITLKGNHRVKLKPGDDVAATLKRYWADLAEKRKGYVKTEKRDAGKTAEKRQSKGRDGQGESETGKGWDFSIWNGTRIHTRNDAAKKNPKSAARIKKHFMEAPEHLRDGLANFVIADSHRNVAGQYQPGSDTVYIALKKTAYSDRQLDGQHAGESGKNFTMTYGTKGTDGQVRGTVIHELTHHFWHTVATEKQRDEWIEKVREIGSVTTYADEYRSWRSATQKQMETKRKNWTRKVRNYSDEIAALESRGEDDYHAARHVEQLKSARDSWSNAIKHMDANNAYRDQAYGNESLAEFSAYYYGGESHTRDMDVYEKLLPHYERIFGGKNGD